jgi:cyclopropane fatty-acyl-phospholipid synthase-like methyltransferase
MSYYEFWQKYRLIPIQSQSDLLFQVGKTVMGAVINQDQFDQIVNSASEALKLCSSDRFMDLCCGNGVLTAELTPKVSRTIGIDFSLPYIENAKNFFNIENLEFIQSDVKNIHLFVEDYQFIPDKVMLYDALAYFTPNEFDSIMHAIWKVLPYNGIFYIGSIPEREKKNRFYNSPRRRIESFVNKKIRKKESGIGRWWSKNELYELAQKNKFSIRFLNQHEILHTSHYRFDSILEKQ